MADAREVALLDDEYQRAVEGNDSEAMAKILADDFVLVVGDGRHYSKEDLLEEARERRIIYEFQKDSNKEVRVWGDTAVVTALLSARGREGGRLFEYNVWFSDTYSRSGGRWKYVFGQSGTRVTIPL